MKTFLIFLMLWSGVCFGQGQLPRDRVYIGNDPQPGGTTPFQLTRSHANIQIVNPQSNNITVKLPTTGILKGEVWKIQTRTATWSTTIQSSDATELYSQLNNGYIIFMALQNTPTGSSHWKRLDVEDNGTYTWTTNSSPNANPWAATKSSIVTYSRRGQIVTLRFTQISANGNNTLEKIIFPDGTVPAKLLCDGGPSPYILNQPGIVSINGTWQQSPGIVQFYCSSHGNAGRIEIQQKHDGTAFQSASTVGFQGWLTTYSTAN
jgi:hypothetical protein